MVVPKSSSDDSAIVYGIASATLEKNKNGSHQILEINGLNLNGQRHLIYRFNP